MSDESGFGNRFERILTGFFAVGSGLILIFLAVHGPMFAGRIHYKTADFVNNQLIGQDAVNLAVLSPLLLLGGLALFFRKPAGKYLLIFTPLFLIYYVLSYTIGWEWSAPGYSGNSERYFFLFLFVLIAALVIMLYTLAVFPRDRTARFSKTGLGVYTGWMALFLLVFAVNWSKEVVQVITTGTARGYDAAPAAFWLVRVFDLGFSIPLGLISLYLLWARPKSSYPIQFLFYGFFLTQIVAVNAMGLMMLVKRDPTFLWRDLAVFSGLGLLLAFGFIYVLRHFKKDPAGLPQAGR